MQINYYHELYLIFFDAYYTYYTIVECAGNNTKVKIAEISL